MSGSLLRPGRIAGLAAPIHRFRDAPVPADADSVERRLAARNEGPPGRPSRRPFGPVRNRGRMLAGRRPMREASP